MLKPFGMPIAPWVWVYSRESEDRLRGRKKKNFVKELAVSTA